MEDLVTFNTRVVKRAAATAAEERERIIPLQKDNESQSKRQNHQKELSENCRKGAVHWGRRTEKEGEMVELVGDQNSSPEAPSRSKKGQDGSH